MLLALPRSRPAPCGLPSSSCILFGPLLTTPTFRPIYEWLGYAPIPRVGLSSRPPEERSTPTKWSMLTTHMPLAFSRNMRKTLNLVSISAAGRQCPKASSHPAFKTHTFSETRKNVLSYLIPRSDRSIQKAMPTLIRLNC